MKGNPNTAELAGDTRDEKVGPALAATMDSTAGAVVDVGRSPKISDSPSSDASELRARAMRYRQLTETLSAASVIAAAQACARELERQAQLMEASKAPL
jgi:hypothetical protein